MTNKLLLLSFGIFFIFSAGAQNRKAANYNNKIIDIQHNLTPDVVDFFKAFEKGDLADLKTKKIALSADFDKAIEKVNAIKGFEGDTKLRDAMLAWLKLYESSLDEEYNQIIELVAIPKDKRTEADRVKLEQLCNELIKKEEAIDQNFEIAQSEFSKRHKLELVEHPIGGTN